MTFAEFSAPPDQKEMYDDVSSKLENNLKSLKENGEFLPKNNNISSLFNVTPPPQPGTIRTILLPRPSSVRALPTEFRSGCWSMRCRSELNPNQKRFEAIKLKPKKNVRRKRPGTLIAATSAQMEDVSSPKQGMANHWSLHYFRFISRWPLLSWKVRPCATDFQCVS